MQSKTKKITVKIVHVMVENLKLVLEAHFTCHLSLSGTFNDVKIRVFD